MKVKVNREHGLFRLMVLFFLVACLSGQNVLGQVNPVTGNVKDETSGEPLPGVAVMVEGSLSGTVTDREGNYTINAQPGQTLIFRSLGYQEQTIEVAGSNVINVVMKDDVQTIENVVVMGYGATSSAVDAIGAVSTITAEQIARRAPVNVFDAMRGEMAGVRITSNSGAPGDGVAVRVRGLTTFEDAGVSPLFVVDGFIVDDISTINIHDVETINVLKDAASAAIYGARAASGVIMITTKSAKAGKVNVTVNFLQKFGQISNTLPQLNRKEASIMSGTVISYSGKDQFAWLGDVADGGSNVNSTSNYYQEMLSRTGTTSQVNLSINGGSEQMRYSISGGYVSEKGVMLNSKNNRANARIKADFQPNQKLRLSSNVTFTYTDTDAINESQVFFNATRRMPQTWIYYPTDGNYVGTWGSYPNSSKRNPMIEIYERQDNTQRFQMAINQQVYVEILPELTFTGNAKAHLEYSQREVYNSPWVQSSRENYEKGQNTLRLTDRFYQNYSLEGFFNYNKVLDGVHNFAAMAGSSIEYKNTKQTTSGGDYLVDEDVRVPQYTNVQTDTRITGPTPSIASFFGRVSYDYQKRYWVTAVLRYDGSSRFGQDKQWGAFPSVQVGWRFSDLLKQSVVSNYMQDGKLRVSWGVTGNDRIGEYDKFALLSGGMSYGYNGSIGVVSGSSPGNPLLKWEQTQETNFGVDLRFLGNRLNVSTDFYIQKTSDLLDKEPIPSELGYSEMRVNGSKIRTIGWEVAVMAKPLDNKHVTWQTSVNWSRDRNKVLALTGDGKGRVYNDYWWLEAGTAPGQFYGYKQLGVYAYDVSNAYTADFTERLTPVFQRDDRGNVMFDYKQDPIVTGYRYADGREFVGAPSKMTINGTVARGGDVIWEDINRDGNISDEDKQKLGSGYSDWYLGWNNSIFFKNFTFSFSFYYSHGGLIYNSALYDVSKYSDNSSAADPRGVTQGWRYQGQLTDWHIPGMNSQNGRSEVDNNRSLSSFYLEDASFLRLQDVRLAYDFPRHMAGKARLSTLQLFVYGSNLLTWTNYRGYDPEINTGTVLSPGRDTSKYPKKREFGFGAVIGF